MAEASLKIGPYAIRTVLTDRFRLDGGAMFGSVPKTLWQKLIPSDENNRIQLGCRSLEIIGDDKNIVVELGMGRKWGRKELEIYVVEYVDPRPFHQIFSPTHIILTHLHFDHCAGISYLEGADLKLSFPDAKIYVSAKNYNQAQNPNIRERASYLRENIEPLSNSNLILTEDGDVLFPGISVHQVDGHTPGLQYVKITDGKSTAVYCADLMPTAHHVQIPYVMGYDLCAQRAMEEKATFLTQAIAENWLVIFGHDVDTAAGYLRINERGRYEVVPYNP